MINETIKIKRLEEQIELLSDLEEQTMNIQDLQRYEGRIREMKKEYVDLTGEEYKGLPRQDERFI